MKINQIQSKRKHGLTNVTKQLEQIFIYFPDYFKNTENFQF